MRRQAQPFIEERKEARMGCEINYKQIVEFMKVVEKFKTCERTCRTTNRQRRESDAEHSWHLALFLILLEPRLNQMDITKLLKLALIHDLPELLAGDTNPYRDDIENKEEKEKRAAEELFSLLPREMERQFSMLFDEYVAQETREAKFVKSIDKLMPLIQNLCTNHEHSSYRSLKVTYPEVKEYMDQFFQDGSFLQTLYQMLLSESHEEGVFFDDAQPDENSRLDAAINNQSPSLCNDEE